MRYVGSSPSLLFRRDEFLYVNTAKHVKGVNGHRYIIGQDLYYWRLEDVIVAIYTNISLRWPQQHTNSHCYI